MIHVMEMDATFIEPDFKTLNLRNDSEIRTNPESFELVTVENALTVEPLLNAPELFNEEHPVMITELLLRTYPWVTQDIINRFQEARKQFAGYKDATKLVNERMSPFRGNVTTAIFGPALQVFKEQGGNEKYRAKAKEIFGDNYESIIRQAEKLMERISYRKSIGHKDERIDDLLTKEMKRVRPNEGILTRLRNMRSEILRIAKNPEEDLRKVFVLGKLTSIAIREADGKGQKFSNRVQLLEEFLNPVEDMEFADYDKKFDLLAKIVNRRSLATKP